MSAIARLSSRLRIPDSEVHRVIKCDRHGNADRNATEEALREAVTEDPESFVQYVDDAPDVEVDL